VCASSMLLYTAPCILYTDTDTDTGHWALYRNRIPLILPFWPSPRRKTLKFFACGALASGGPSNTPFSPPSGGFVTADLRNTPGKTAGCWERGWTRRRVGRRCSDCDCGARGLRGLGSWIWEIRLQAPRGPALRVRDSVAAAATWLDIARYSDTGGISQRYTPGGGLSRHN